jgi:hypothetical protein
MLTISQLAAHAGVTVRAVRHYHQIGLLPEPERDHSGYGRTTPLRSCGSSRSGPSPKPACHWPGYRSSSTPPRRTSPREWKEIDKELRAEIGRLQDNRKRIARLAAGESLALPQSAVDYLDTLRRLGVDERYIELERDAWIMVAARVPHLIDSVIAKKRQELADPDMVKLYRLLSEALDWPADDPRIVEIADVLERLMTRALDAGEELSVDLDDPFVDLLDTTMLETSPLAGRLLAILEERGWRGWTRIERLPPE